MPHSISFLLIFVLVLVCAKPSDDSDEDLNSNQCLRLNCVGQEYECIDGNCYCSDGFIPSPFQNRCVRCPGFGEKCFGPCCSRNGNINVTLSCWKGICQRCHDPYNNFICRDSLDNLLLISSTQIAMATALVLGIIATFVLLYKLCAATSIRPMGSRSVESRLSVGSLQVYVEERLRDAPPRYSRTPPSAAAGIPATVYINAGFIHDSSIPPPPYTPPKEDDTQTQQNPPAVQPAIHI